MDYDQTIKTLSATHTVIATCDLDSLDDDPEKFWQQVKSFCTANHKSAYESNELIVFFITKDFYDDRPAGIRLSTLQKVINEVDISNFFVQVVTTNENWKTEQQELLEISTDKVPIRFLQVSGEFHSAQGVKSKYSDYRYGSPEPIKIAISELTERQRFLLMDSKVFCMYPWIHLHAYPTGEAYPCCHAEQKHPVGNCKQKTLQEIWNDKPMQQLRDDMLNERFNETCTRCYEQEAAGFFSGRQSANKHHGHHVKKLDDNPFEMTYWDIRFSNLCNLRCRSCGHIFSSSWYQDQVQLAGSEWAKNNRVLNFAGRTDIDMWEQLVPHFDYVEQIYFAGGEPLMMEEHYRILEELERRERFDVRLIYNTNFTQTKLKDRYVFDYWRKFDSVAVGASLDAMGARGEYIRKGTDWAVVEENRRRMIDTCPGVDFYISPTLSIMNAWHITDFHRDWVERGLLRPQDLNVNILQGPEHFRIDIAPIRYKQRLRMKWEEHLEWLRPQDQLRRATVGFESAINFMMATDNSHLLDRFRDRTARLDGIRAEHILDYLPELEILYNENTTF